MDFIEFLVKAKKATYASENAQKRMLEDGSTELVFSEGSMMYRDRYFGNVDFIGEELLFVDGKKFWGMNYYGSTFPEIDPKMVALFLREALRMADENHPYRGPPDFKKGELDYTNESKGAPSKFFGVERIFLNDRLVYELFYHGGTIR